MATDPHGQELWYTHGGLVQNMDDQPIQPSNWLSYTPAVLSGTNGQAPLANVSHNMPLDGWPLTEPGTLHCVNPSDRCVNPSELSLLSADKSSSKADWTSEQYLIEKAGDTNISHDSGFDEPPRPQHSGHSIVPSSYHSLQPPPRISVNALYAPHMSPGTSAEGDDGRQNSHHFRPAPGPAQLTHSQHPPTVPYRKRGRDLYMLGEISHDGASRRASKTPRMESYQANQANLTHSSNGLSYALTQPVHLTNVPIRPQPAQPTTWPTGASNITNKQKRFIQKWHRDFVKDQGNPYLSSEDIAALATLLKVPVYAVHEYIHRKYISPPAAQSTTNFQLDAAQPHMNQTGSKNSNSGYSIRGANAHLSPEDLRLVEAYVKGAKRPRARKDGRRKKNEGPFQCTFGCGYRTERAFDWRRHEETHEPQELWLCHLCRQTREKSPYLVNRKDKFIKHAKHVHKGWEPEHLLSMSNTSFNANMDPECPFCDEHFNSWEDRCQRILAHYEDNVHRGSLRSPLQPGLLGKSGDTTDEDDSDPGGESDSADSSDDEDGNSGPSQQPHGRGGPAGGSGGGPGHMGNPSRYGDQGGRRHNPSDSSGSYSSYSGFEFGFMSGNTTHSAFAEEEAMDGAGIQTILLPRLSTDRFGAATDIQLNQQLITASEDSLLTTSSSFRRLHSLSSPGRSQPRLPLLAYLGRGSHGIVDIVQEYITGRTFARKRSRDKSLFREVDILKRLKHPHIVEFVTAYTQNLLLNLVISPVAQLTLHEFMRGDVNPDNDVGRLQAWVGCLSSALSYIHSNRIRHADIKPHNILLRDWGVLISDFGISRLVSEPDSTSSSDSPYTPLYAAPEIAKRLPHGRKADTFSLGCVFVEILTHVHGKRIGELHDYLGFTNRARRLSQDAIAYYKVQEKLHSWISFMQQSATAASWRLWDECGRMLQNDSSIRPSSSILLENVRNALVVGNVPPCDACAIASPALDRGPGLGLNFDDGSPTALESQKFPVSNTESPIKMLMHEDPRADQSALAFVKSGNKDVKDGQDAGVTLSETCFTPSVRSNCSFTCTLRRKGSSALLGYLDILIPYEQSSFDPYCQPMLSYEVALASPPAYDHQSVFPVSISDSGNGHAAQIMLGKIGTDSLHERDHGMRATSTPRLLAHALCHKCSTRFVAPRMTDCRNCSHVRCELCLIVGNPPSNRVPRKADSDLAEIGSHLPPPAYASHDGSLHHPVGDSIRDPLAQVHSENAVFELVIEDSEALGNNPGTRFIGDRPSTFDRIHSPRPSSRHTYPSSPTTSISEIDYQLDHPSDIESGIFTVTSTTSLSSLQTLSKATRHETHPTRPSIQSSHRLSRRKSRQFVSGRSKQTIHIKQEQRAMNGHHTTTLDSRDLSCRLTRIKKSYSAPNDGDIVSRLPRISQSGRTSSTESEMSSRLPAFPKSPTSSTNSSSTDHQVARLEVLQTRTLPLLSTNTESAQVEQGEFSKRRVRRRRQSNESSKSQKEFQYYGRHANSWLFNDFSLSGSVKKGFSKVFQGGKNDEDE